jgi:hypothetical protein
MLNELMWKFDYQCRTSETFKLQLERVSKFRDKNFAYYILWNSYKNRNGDIGVLRAQDDIAYYANVTLHNFGTRSGLFLKLSKGDGVQMKTFLEFIIKDNKYVYESDAERVVANEDESPLLSNEEESIKCVEDNGDVNCNSWSILSQFSDMLSFDSNLNETFSENFFEEILIEKKRLQDLLAQEKLDAENETILIENIKRNEEKKVLDDNFDFYSDSFDFYSIAKKIESIAKSIKDKEDAIAKSIRDKEDAKVLKRVQQKADTKVYNKRIAAQSISRKKGCRGNKAGDGNSNPC